MKTLETETMELSEKALEIKFEDKKASKPFILLCIGGFMIGFVVAMGLVVLKYRFFSNMEISFLEAFEQFQLNLSNVFRYLNFIQVFILATISYFIVFKCKKMYNEVDFSNEDLSNNVIEKIEETLDYPLFLTSIMNILSWICFGVGLYGLSSGNNQNLVSFAFCFIAFILSTVFHTHLQQLCVNLVKELNPEKEGSVFDPKFADKWLNSCDEAQQYLIYKSSFKAYKNTQITCLILMVVLACFGMFLSIGTLPLIVTCIICLVLNISYMLESMKLSKRK